jgi:YidC/Oxa1 family membrane protein insertase
MDNNKNFITAIALTILVIFFYPMMMKKMFPEHFAQNQSQMEEPASVQAPTSPEILKPSVENAVTYDKINSYMLKNNLFTIILNAPGGDISSIELNQIPDPVDDQPTVLMETFDQYPGIFSTKELLQGAKLENVQADYSNISFIYKKNENLKIVKTITAAEDMYKIDLQVTIENIGTEQQSVPYQIVTSVGLPEADGIASRFQNIITYYDDDKKFKKNPKSIKELKTINANVSVGGVVARYFALIVKPLSGSDYFYTLNQDYGNIYGIGKNNVLVGSGESVSQEYVLYAGPNSHEEMAALGLSIEEVRGKGFFAGFSDLLLLMLRWLYMVLRNYGLAVIGLALVINLMLYPLTFKSLKSMKEMQALQPMVENLRNQFKDNPEKLNKEIMELYKKHKVNPAGGCLPMLLQMPVFFSLYGVLMRAIELRGADFLWIKDLAAPDALFTFSSKLPFIGHTFNLLPILMVVLTFLQQKLTSPSQGNDQQKAMMIMMPLFLGFIFYGFPSGLVLYFLTNSVFSFFVQAKLSKQFEQQLAA